MFRAFVWLVFGMLPVLLSFSAQAQELPVSIHSIRLNTQEQALTVLSSQQLNPQIQYFKQAGPEKIVLDLPNTVFPPVHQEIPSSLVGIEKVRISQFQNNPPTVRMVMDLQRHLEINVRSRRLGDQYETRIEPVQSAPEADPAHKSGNQELRDIRLVGQNLVIEANAPLYPEIRLVNKQQKEYLLSVYDFNTRLNGLQAGLSSKLVESLRVAQDNKGVHLRLRLTRDDIEIVPFCEDHFCTLQFLVKASSQDLARFEKLQVDELDRQTTRLRLYANKPFDYQLYPLSNPDRLVIDTLGTIYEPQRRLEQSVKNSQNIRSVRFIPTQTAQQADVRVVLDLSGQVVYEFNWKDNYLEILLKGKATHKPIFNANNRRAFVVIDPGHGGNDPGALGVQKNQEKQITLAVSNLLQHYLEADNIQAVMTRTEDLEVLLQPRVDIANVRNADIFVSIHCNSMPPGNTHVRGIETYYTTPQSKELADTLHKYMVKELGAQDRRVRKRGLFVTRKTNMPSVLLEIGFLSSPEEEALLSNPAYQRRVAKAIRDGIYDYLSQNQKLKPQL